MENMTKETQEKLASSLTAETTELIPFLPYLLQDFWELGSDPDAIVEVVKNHIPLSKNTKILDLACGKGAVSVKLAQKLGVKVKGVDLLTDFLDYAKEKAQEYNVSDLCEFAHGDINEAVKTEKGYDCVVFIATGDLLGEPTETLNKLKSTVGPGGYIITGADYLPDGGKQEDVKHSASNFYTEAQWADFIDEAGLKLLEIFTEDELDSDTGMTFITARANELIEKHPNKKAMFEKYVKSQQDEYLDLKDNLNCVGLILKALR